MESLEKTGFFDRPKTKMDLIERVGSKGKYQFTLLLIFCSIWCITGMALIGAPFFFIDNSFECHKLGLITENCKKSVCSLPKSEWSKYQILDENSLHTIPVEFGPYLCDDEVYINFSSSSVYVGAFVGYILFSFFSDNYGRRKTMVLAWGVASIGSLLMLFSVNLVMVSFGLFLLGAGSDAAITLSLNFLGEVVDNEVRQKYSVILQPWFAIGACIVTTGSIFINNWKVLLLIFVVIPCFVILIFVLIYVEETPQFLLPQGIPKTLKSLNRIGKINKGVKNILNEQDIMNVIHEEVEYKEFRQMLSPLDLCRYGSLRTKTLCLGFISFAVYILYYGPILIVDKIGFNVYVSSYVVEFSELIVYIPLYYFINRIPRQKAGIVLFSIAGICSGFLLFVNKPDNCILCGEAIFELVIVAVFRSSSALYFILLLIYMVELYPARARGMGTSITSSVGTIASSSSPIILGTFYRNNININILFCLISILAIGVVTLLPETKGLPLFEEIEEIEMEKQIQKGQYGIHEIQDSPNKSELQIEPNKYEFEPFKSEKV